jgi:hypothetical protein
MKAVRVRETLRLTRGEVRRVLAVPGTVVRVERGRIWLTEHGGGRDWHVCAGEAHGVEAHGVTVLESLVPAVVQVLRPAPLRALAAEALLRALRRAIRRVACAGRCVRTDSPA